MYYFRGNIKKRFLLYFSLPIHTAALVSEYSFHGKLLNLHLQQVSSQSLQLHHMVSSHDLQKTATQLLNCGLADGSKD